MLIAKCRLQVKEEQVIVAGDREAVSTLPRWYRYLTSEDRQADVSKKPPRPKALGAASGCYHATRAPMADADAVAKKAAI